jgi:hypothetical protein
VAPEDTQQPADPEGAAPTDTAEPPALPELEPPSPEAQLSPEELAAAFDAAWAGGVPEPRTPRDVYLSLMAMGDEECPGDPEQIVSIVLGCTSASGWTYAGTTEYKVQGEESDREGWQLTGDATIDGPDGERFVAGGHVNLARKERGSGGWHWEGEIQGTWSYLGAGGWLEDGLSAKLQIASDRGESREEIVVEGGMGLASMALVFEGLELSTDCPEAARGALWLRDPSGGWFYAEFSEECSSCGALSFEGAPYDEPFCLDFSPLTERFSTLEVP